MTTEDKQPKGYSLKVTFECPSGIKKEYVEKYVKDHVFIEGWAGIFATNYLDIKEFTFSDCPVSTQGGAAPEPTADYRHVINLDKFLKLFDRYVHDTFCLSEREKNETLEETFDILIRCTQLKTEHDAAIREEALDEVRDRCAEKMSDKNPEISGVMLSYILADLRQHKEQP